MIPKGMIVPGIVIERTCGSHPWTPPAIGTVIRVDGEEARVRYRDGRERTGTIANLSARFHIKEEKGRDMMSKPVNENGSTTRKANDAKKTKGRRSQLPPVPKVGEVHTSGGYGNKATRPRRVIKVAEAFNLTRNKMEPRILFKPIDGEGPPRWVWYSTYCDSGAALWSPPVPEVEAPPAPVASEPPPIFNWQDMAKMMVEALAPHESVRLITARLDTMNAHHENMVRILEQIRDETKKHGAKTGMLVSVCEDGFTRPPSRSNGAGSSHG